MAATTFCFETLKTGGHFVCKFYQGAEDKALELLLKRFFEKVHRDKPGSSRSVSTISDSDIQSTANVNHQESKEAYFVALRRKEDPLREDVFRNSIG